MSIRGTTETLRTVLTNPDTGALEDAGAGTLSLLVVKPNGDENTYAMGEITRDSLGHYHKSVLGDVSGLWHFYWLVNGSAADEGTWTVESDFDNEFAENETPDLTDLKVLVPRAKRKVEGPWGNPTGRPPLTNTQVYEMVADACAEIKMLSGSFFHHTLKVKSRDPLVGFPTAWQTDTPLEEYEAAIVCAQVGLNYYYHLFRDMKISETIQNEGTQWTYELSANVIRNYLESLVEERDKAVAGLRINIPVMDRFASNIRVRDQATVAVLEWWDNNSPGVTGGGLPGGQEATSIPWFPGPG